MQNISHQSATGKLVSGYLFFCPDKVTLNEALLCSAKVILCNKGGLDACPTCQQIQCGSHPDVCVYPKGDAFNTQDSKVVIEDSNKKPILAKYKLILIKDLDNSSEQSQNKLLKILETPPSNTIFLISTTNLNKVLTTIKSRLVKVEIPPFDSNCLDEIFSDYKNKEDFSLALEYGNGYIGTTLEILDDEDFMESYNLAKKIVLTMKSSAEIVNYLVPKISKNQFIRTITLMQSMYLDIAIIKAGKSTLIKNKTLLADLTTLENEFSMRALTSIIKRINEINKKQYSNVTLSLLFESLLTSILEVKYLCK